MLINQPTNPPTHQLTNLPTHQSRNQLTYDHTISQRAIINSSITPLAIKVPSALVSAKYSTYLKRSKPSLALYRVDAHGIMLFLVLCYEAEWRDQLCGQFGSGRQKNLPFDKLRNRLSKGYNFLTVDFRWWWAGISTFSGFG